MVNFFFFETIVKFIIDVDIHVCIHDIVMSLSRNYLPSVASMMCHMIMTHVAR